jgi:hypothetical protein
MKSSSLLLLALALCACESVPGLANPRVTLAPQVTFLRIQGKASMQSLVGGNLVDRPPQTERELGIASREEDVAGTLQVGDGFSGVELGYQPLDVEGTGVGFLDFGFGSLDPGDTVRSELELEEWRLAWLAQVVGVQPREDLHFQLGLGAALYHRELKLRLRELGGARQQRLTLEDPGLPYAVARGRATWGRVFGQVDYALNPDLSWGGDFDGVLNDLALRVGVTFPDQEVALFAGWRFDEFAGDGFEGGRRFDVDLRLEGFFVGGELTF